MYVTIWDMDYYYAETKVNCFNPDVMKISSYHKQCGDIVNFVTKEVDIFRSYDLCYIIKNNKKLPHPPKSFFLDSSKVKWWGKAYEGRIKWHMSDAMLGCRPDYLLYPEKNTKDERSEQVRFFNFKAQLVPLSQDWRNTFKNKFVIITDTNMWFAQDKDILFVLESLAEVKNIKFLEPIWIQKLISNKDIRDAFFKLNFIPGSNIRWNTERVSDVEETFSIIKEFKARFPHVSAGKIEIDYRLKGNDHWADKAAALDDFNRLKKIVSIGKTEGIYQIEIKMPPSQFDTPYFFLFSELSIWTQRKIKYAWIEFVTERWSKPTIYAHSGNIHNYWWHPEKWTPIVRDLFRQSFEDKEFLLHKWKNEYVNEGLIPWDMWKETFKNGL